MPLFGQVEEDVEQTLEEMVTEFDPHQLEDFAKISEASSKAIAAANRVTTIDDRETSGLAADALKALKHVRTDAETARKAHGRIFNDAKGRIDAMFNEVKEPIAGVEASLKDRLLAYENQKAAEAQAAREQEEREAAEAQEVENEEAEAEGRASHHVAPPAPKVQPKGARGASGAKASPVGELKYEILDESALPDEYVTRTPNRSKILVDVRAGIVIPGVRPYKDQNVRVS